MVMQEALFYEITRHERPCHRASSADFFNDIRHKRTFLHRLEERLF
ncbi:MAG TPA: hypothetical protein PK706_15100 [Xanthobacteraceae bacterium]|jgi:hypothetical protein|nr:hypothetical protein [Xanthobacteraceae bacterium]